MKVSEISLTDLANYLRIEEETELQVMLDSAKAFIKSYTGLTNEEIDEHEDFVIVVYILVQDMYDNRVLYIDRGNLNKTVSTILDMHSVNLI